PGVRASCLSSFAPFFTMPTNGEMVSSDASTHEANIVYFTPECFDVLGIELLSGKTWGEEAQMSAPGTAIISRLLADHLFPHESAIGRDINLKGANGNRHFLVTGVAADARLFTPGGVPPPALYLNYWQSTEVQSSWNIVMVRTAGDTQYLLKPIKDMVDKIGTDYVGYIRPLDAQLDMAMSQDSMLSFGASSFAAIALLLSAVGIFGILTFFVNRQKAEIGIRMALGADRRTILKEIFRQSLQLAAWGLTLGVVLSIELSTVVTHYLYGDVSTMLPLLIAVGTALTAVLVAASIPAFRASRLDPNETLRQI
ncbi:MAG TPA: FtsX-like permease family protein, partial [Bryobacteraceae bacterium]